MSNQQLVSLGKFHAADVDPGGGRTPVRYERVVAFALAGLVGVAVLLAGCGSSKPAYCSKVSDLTKSVQDVAKLETIKKGPAAVGSAVDKVKTAAHTLVGAAKSDFPNETGAITSAVDALSKSARQLSSPSAAAIAALPGQIAATSTAISNFASATSSKCG